MDEQTELESIVMATRVTPGDYELLKTVCVARGENFSTFLRRSLRGELARLSYYSPEVKKALGVKIEEIGGV